MSFTGYNLQKIKVPGSSAEYNINMEPNYLPEFDQIIPKYDRTTGIYIELMEHGKTKRVEIKRNIYEKFYHNLVDPTAVELMESYMPMRVEMTKHLVNKTYAKGFEKPAAIQRLVIVALIEGRDLLAQSKSGTGKTHGFLMGNLFHYDPYDSALQHVFITSSHEVARQIYEQAKNMLPDQAKVALCIGQKRGTSTRGSFRKDASSQQQSSQIKDIKNAQVLVCTMGKFNDLFINRKLIDTTFLKTFCVDEFDAIVSSNRQDENSTQEQMANIICNIPEFTIRSFFSATTDENSSAIAHHYFRDSSPLNDEPVDNFEEDYRGPGDPLLIFLDEDDTTLDGIVQYYVELRDTEDKNNVLIDIIRNCRIDQLCVFANTKERVQDISNCINGHIKNGMPLMPCGIMHSDMSSEARTKIFQDFGKGTVRILVASDVAARGLDVHGVSLVINYDMPNDLATYIHRIGRSGRYGRKGKSISFIVKTEDTDETAKIDEINKVSTKSKVMPLPDNIAELAI